jgi:hypothetical protein
MVVACRIARAKLQKTQGKTVEKPGHKPQRALLAAHGYAARSLVPHSGIRYELLISSTFLPADASFPGSRQERKFGTARFDTPDIPVTIKM